MVGDEHQRVENNFHRKRFKGEGSFSNLQIARYGLDDDGEQYEVGQAGPDVDSGSLACGLPPLVPIGGTPTSGFEAATLLSRAWHGTVLQWESFVWRGM